MDLAVTYLAMNQSYTGPVALHARICLVKSVGERSVAYMLAWPTLNTKTHFFVSNFVSICLQNEKRGNCITAFCECFCSLICQGTVARAFAGTFSFDV